MAYVLQFLNMNCWEIFWLDPNLVQVIAGFEWQGLEKYQRISWAQNEEMKRRKDDSGDEGIGRRRRTPRTVLILGGKDVMSLLYTQKFGFLNVRCTPSSGEELKAKALPEEK